MRKLSFIENVFSLVNIFPNKKQLTVLGISWIWEKKHPFEGQQIQKNKVVFWAYSNSFTCNPKYIALKLIELTDKLDIVWVSDRQIEYDKKLEGKIRFVHGIENSVKELSTARVIVSNERMNYWMYRKFLKREGQYIINTWHGSLGIKKTGQDRNDLTKEEIDILKIDSKAVDYIVSNSDYSDSLYKRIFFNNGELIKTGLPRNDIFFREKNNKVHNYYSVPDEVRFVLYAPTWREIVSEDCININPDIVVEALEKKFGGKWLFLIRKHHFSKHNEINYDGIIDVTLYQDIQEIMMESDALITDYSSCIYDFILTGKPGFIYATDRKEYEESRGLYYPLDKTPFPVSENMSELLNSILGFNEKEYQQNVKSFLREKGCMDDGHASERMALLINGLVNDTQKCLSTRQS